MVPGGSTDIDDIKRMYYYEAVAMGLVWLATIVYFPAYVAFWRTVRSV